MLYITPFCSLLHTFLKDKCMCLQEECRTSTILKYFCPLYIASLANKLFLMHLIKKLHQTCRVYPFDLEF